MPVVVAAVSCGCAMRDGAGARLAPVGVAVVLHRVARVLVVRVGLVLKLAGGLLS